MNTDVIIDREQCWLVFCTFSGDCVRTGHALGVPPASILKLSEEEGWTARIAPIIALAASQKPGDLDRATNRAISFVMAHKLRILLSRVLNDLSGLNQEELREHCVETSTDKSGQTKTKVSCRFLTDLAAAFEKASSMAAQALSDTASDRAKRDETDSAHSVVDLHAAIAASMARAGASNTPRSCLLDSQLTLAAEIAGEDVKPKSPYDIES